MATGTTTRTRVRGPPSVPGDRHAAAYRHPGDLLRVGLGLALLGLTILIARQGELSVVETDVFRLLNN